MINFDGYTSENLNRTVFTKLLQPPVKIQK